MQITNVETFLILPRWSLVKITTDTGITGWGEPTLEGKTTAVAQMIDIYKELLLGQDPTEIEMLYNKMYRGGFYRCGAVATSAISGIEQALWDIKGKWLGVPVWQLLGGKCRDRIRMYAHVTPDSLTPTTQQIAEATRRRIGQGFTALKTAPMAPLRHIETLEVAERIAENFAAIREAAGKNIDIAIDFHGRVSPALAPLLFKKLEPYFPMFVEECVLPENVDVMAKMARMTTIPLATGERLVTTYQYRDVIEKQAATVLQPDLCHCGGILQAYKIAALADTYYCSIAPHNPLGPVALAACLQLDTCISNFTAQEHPTRDDGADLGVGILREPFVIRDGYIDIPTKPGLGIEVDEEAIQNILYDGKWTNPLLYFEDDHSLAEW